MGCKPTYRGIRFDSLRDIQDFIQEDNKNELTSDFISDAEAFIRRLS
jgi:hypothetical protein